MEVYTQKRLLPEPPEEFVKRLTEWYDDGKQKGVIVKEEVGDGVLKTLFTEENDCISCRKKYWLKEVK